MSKCENCKYLIYYNEGNGIAEVRCRKLDYKILGEKFICGKYKAKRGRK